MRPKRSSAGRPELPERERRKPTMIRLSDLERSRYERAAERAGMSLAGWLRWAADSVLQGDEGGEGAGAKKKSRKQ